MEDLEGVRGNLLRVPDDAEYETGVRDQSSYKPLHTFRLNKERSYQQQYGNMYFLRLTKIKPAVEQIASAAWTGTKIGGETAKQVERVLDVRQGELCWVAGTVYMDMPLKPNILDDVSKDRWISAPVGTQKYISGPEKDQVMLEDDSGRIRLVGDLLKDVHLVTGCIIAVMGTENVNGELEALDIKFPDLPPQPERWALSKSKVKSESKSKRKVKQEDDVDMADAPSPSSSKKIAVVSGLAFSSSDASYSLELALLLEFLLGEALDPNTQSEIAHISRLIIAGNSIRTDDQTSGASAEKKHKKYGYDASAYNPIPSQLFDDFLYELLPSIPITLLPGAKDPANASYPQQPIHCAMFPKAREYAAEQTPKKGDEPGWFDPVTNPFEAEIEGWRVLGTGGQNVDDIFKYVETDDRVGMMEAMCRWRCSAPTAPDTLWSYPFKDDDPFVMMECPHLFFVGCQPQFGTRVIEGPDGQVVRLVAVPNFYETKEIVLIDTETLEASKVRIAVG